MGRCAICSKLISTGTIITALESTFHGGCFRCRLCNLSLEDSPFYGCERQPFCESCIDQAEELSRQGQLGSKIGASEVSESVPVAQKGASMGEEAPLVATPAPAEDSPDATYEDHKCQKCAKSIQGTIVNALGATWCESCFACNQCGAELDHFFGCDDGFPYCENCIDQAEDRYLASHPQSPAVAPAATATVEASSAAPPRVTNAFANVSSSDLLSGKPPGPALESLTWEQRAIRAEEDVVLLKGKLSQIKVALLEERRVASEEYDAAQQELELMKARAELAEKKLRDAGDIEIEREKVARLTERLDQLAQGDTKLEHELQDSQAKRQELERENASLRQELALLKSRAASSNQLVQDDQLSRTLTQLEQANARIRDLTVELSDARAAASLASASSPSPDVVSAGPGVPPPPPPGAPPPPPPVNISQRVPLKITHTGQANLAAKADAEESNPQADIIAELKKGRPMLRRTAGVRPSKRDLLAKHGNVRMEPSRPDPSLVKGADTGNEFSRKMASNAQTTAVKAVERDDRVQKGEIRMKVHRNKFLDAFLDSDEMKM